MRPHTALQDAPEAGFTLLELIVVLVIVALAIAVALPNAEFSRRGLSLRSAAIDLASAMGTARAQAIRNSRDAFVTIDPNGRRFAAEGQTRPHPLPRDLTMSLDVPAGEQTAEGRAVVRFRPDGSSSGARVILRQRRQTASVTVDWLTGRTHIVWGL